MVVVVQLLARDQQSPRHDVRGHVRQLEASIADVMAKPIDDACGEQGLCDELYPEHGYGRHAEHDHLQRNEDGDTYYGKTAIEVALQPVVRCPTPVVRKNLRVTGRCCVKLVALQYDAPQTEHRRTVRVTLSVGKRVMTAVNGNPLPRHRSRGEPQPESEEVPHRRMQHQAPMCLVAMQVQRHP